ncbi:hypothetical protein AYI68_g3213 [Smittium mucronatum]|uniref:Uncharacterized protein n=1 Tax=Smittium mucronatum TaxID=133383 RepID=A0A1R0H0J6_9FUNG|nr:hypothetical protein AYI68_g3213 [Smittium mucronatum]
MSPFFFVITKKLDNSKKYCSIISGFFLLSGSGLNFGFAVVGGVGAVNGIRKPSDISERTHPSFAVLSHSL